MMIPNINCIHNKKGRCTFLKHNKECIVISGKKCGMQQNHPKPDTPPPPPKKMRLPYQNCYDCKHKELINNLVCGACTTGNHFINYEKVLPSLTEKDKELQIEKCLKLSVELWHEYLKLPVEHPNQVDEFAAAIHVIQEKLALKIARIYRPDLYPNKMKEE